MATTTTSDIVEASTPYPSLAAPPPPARPRVLLVGTLLASAAMVMAYVGLIGTYIALRAASEGGWLPDGVTIPLAPPNMAAVTVLMSVVTVHWARDAIRNDDRPNAYVALVLTLVLGLAFINSNVYLFTQMGAAVGGSVPELMLYVVGGFHIATFAAAIVFVALMSFRTLGGQYSGRDSEGLGAAAVLWDAAVACYLVSWYAVYVTK
jgi:heme/copper-type cytochrome/quinol oxidase subunit 3